MNLKITHDEISEAVAFLEKAAPGSPLFSAASKGVDLALSKLKKSWRFVDVAKEEFFPGDLYLKLTGTTTASWLPAVNADGTLRDRVVHCLENNPQHLIIKRPVLSIDDVPPPQEPTLLEAAKAFAGGLPAQAKLTHAHDLMAAIEREEARLSGENK